MGLSLSHIHTAPPWPTTGQSHLALSLTLALSAHRAEDRKPPRLIPPRGSAMRLSPTEDAQQTGGRHYQAGNGRLWNEGDPLTLSYKIIEIEIS